MRRRQPLFLRILPLFLAWHCHPAHGADDAPPVNPSAIRAELDKLENAHRNASNQFRQKALETLRQGTAGGGSSAARLYEEALGSTGQPDMASWKKKNADLLRAKPFQEAVQLHLRYLALSLERGRSDDAARWAEPSLQYARNLAQQQADQDFRQGPGPAREILGKPLAESPFVRWMQVGPLLPPADSWEQVPGNLGGILEKNVRRPWRQAGDARLDSAWQLELEAGAALATADGSDRAAEEFNTRTAPSLQFRRARDRAAAGQANQAAAEILELARRHPAHPEFPQWAATLREMLEKLANTPPGQVPKSDP